MANFYGWLVNKLKYKRLGVSTPTKLMAFGAIYTGTYSNWKHDARPLIWIQWCDELITHGINTHYLNRADKQWFAQMIYLVKKAGQNIDPRTFYFFIKQQRPNIIKTAYRMYHTNLLNMKLVCAGITPLDELIYTYSTDPWIAALNEMIKPSEMKEGPTKISFSPTELAERINLARNSISITKQTVQSKGPKAPYTSPAPYAVRKI
jgi:hypothetical protein